MGDLEPWVIWCLVVAALLVIEMLTPGLFFFACFGLGALLAAVASNFGLSIWVVWTVFLGTGLLGVLATRPAVERLTKGAGRPSNVDALLGREALVKLAISPFEPGVITVGSEEWRAKSQSEIPAGAVVLVKGVDGSSLVVQPKE